MKKVILSLVLLGLSTGCGDDKGTAVVAGGGGTGGAATCVGGAVAQSLSWLTCSHFICISYPYSLD